MTAVLDVDEGFVHASAVDRRYVRAVDRRLAQHAAQWSRGVAPQALFGDMEGAFPTLVWERLTAAGLAACMRDGEEPVPSHWNQRAPELHALDFEWYFTAESAEYLADAVCRQKESTICLGAPTVAAAAVRKERHVILVERNPVVVNRFPALLRTSKLWLIDIAECEQHLEAAGAVVFDAPWYVPCLRSWLALAHRIVRPGGLIAFSLFGPLLRPNANAEREQILELSASLGKVDIIEKAITYETPLFETEALLAAGIRGIGNWRRADLVLVRTDGRRSPVLDGLRPKPSTSEWFTYVLGPRVIKLRKGIRANRPRAVSVTSLPGSRGYAYPSVSARDPKRQIIDLWTSRNKVARIGDVGSVMRLLTLLERGEELASAIRGLFPDLPVRRRQDMEASFHELLS